MKDRFKFYMFLFILSFFFMSFWNGAAHVSFAEELAETPVQEEVDENRSESKSDSENETKEDVGSEENGLNESQIQKENGQLPPMPDDLSDDSPDEMMEENLDANQAERSHETEKETPEEDQDIKAEENISGSLGENDSRENREIQEESLPAQRNAGSASVLEIGLLSDTTLSAEYTE